MNINQRDLQTITVCASEDVPEVELVSLLEDQLPQYQLRVDSLYLYNDQDWIDSPSPQKNAASSLSPILADETFRYMTFAELPSSLDGSHKSSNLAPVLGTERVTQMNKAYNDIDMVTHLLAEKDRDLELAARIGQALLKRTHILTEQNESVEEQLARALDQVNQLQHELSKKDELLRVVSIASEESETDSSCSTPLRSNESFNLSQGLLQLESLQGKLRELEEENLALRSQACHLKTETITYEEKEQQLVIECVNEIRESNAEIGRLTEELSEKNEELARYQEEIATLLTQIVDLQHKLKEYAIEKEELKLHLQASKGAQRQLTAELHELQDRNAECLGMLNESQEEVKTLRSKSSPAAILQRPQSYSGFPVDSLAAEIEGTMRRELFMNEESSFGEKKNQQKRVFDTVKVANDAVRSRSASFPPPRPIPGSNRSGVVMTAKPFESGVQLEEKQKNQKSSLKEEKELSKDPLNQGQPRIPEGNDLAMALHRLCLRQQNYLCEKQFFEDERERKLKLLEDQKDDSSGCNSPTGSFLSLATHQSEFTDFSGSSSCLRSLLPEKLQIVKPLEGSQTLHHWQQLAQPNLGTLLDPRPGVVTKGFTSLPEDTVCHLWDLEEDEEEEGISFEVQQSSFLEEGKASVPKPTVGIFLPTITPATVPSTASHPGKCLSFTNSTFTFTNCRILHPSDVTQVTPSSMYNPVSFGNNSGCITSTVVSSPAMSCRFSLGESFTDRRDFTPTSSSTTNLTKLLQEQGISAKVYSNPTFEKPLFQRASRTFTIPSTPPNSPSLSPCSSPLPFESRSTLSENFLASRPAETFLQEMYGMKTVRNPPDLGKLKMNLVERLKRLGIARVVKPPDSGEHNKGQTLETELQKQDSTVFLGTGSSLMGGLRRNQSLPALIGGLPPPVCTSSPKVSTLKEIIVRGYLTSS
ncbi:trafficking kinesin-binding protein 2 isoform X2 [Microcaecilia unicolor]|uniref:Trafficking kinesin-binding protein 2 isoform X2 n=1 Tax=Microcaecilia unicolor TaxID=1415580 RepID=A0A6P7YJ64_9AMPH|nr:trafficking kinesin-binding protein 2 isoform X2 [Microcaecilia unicolor]